jgi:metal-responsive CopG/Arc/MetJ family transcriptional regulator
MRSVLSISLPEKISSELNELAKKTGRNKSDIVKESITLYLWDARYQKLRRQLNVKAKKAAIITEEDVFKAIS